MGLPPELLKKVEETRQAFPWYAELVRGLPRDSWNELPYMTAEVLERFYYNQEYIDPEYSVYRTSGTSTGKRKAILYDTKDDEHYIDVKVKLYRELIGATKIERALADMGTGHAASTALTVFERLGYQALAIDFSKPVEEHVQALEQFKPQLLYTMPSILDHILHAAQNPKEWGLEKVILVGEVAPITWQQNAAATLGIPDSSITDTLGSIEIGTMAYYSHELQRYLMAEGIVAETATLQEVGLEAEDLREDEGILVVTSLIRDRFPATKFVTYDVVRDFRTIEVDGKPCQSFQSIVKRVGKEIKHGEKISLYDIEEVVFRHLKQASVRVQVKNNALTVMLRSNEEICEECISHIRDEIQGQIVEIGQMIAGGLLDRIEVIVPAQEEWLKGSVKSKKIYS